MAEIGTSVNYLDLAKRSDPDGKIAKIMEVLAETNQILDDALTVQCNQGTKHLTTVRKGLPTVTWRKLNYGVPKSKSKTAQVTDACGMLEAYAEVDKSLADINGNTAEFRASEDRAFLEAMSQEWAETTFYGDQSVNETEFTGLSPRYNDLSAESGANIIDAGGTGSDNASIWMITWGPNETHYLYPNGSMAGMQHKDLGEQTLEDAAGGQYQGYRTHYKLDVGLSVRDWRYNVRIANIDVSDLTKDASGDSADLVDLMTQAIELLPNELHGRMAFYCNKTIRSFLRRQIKNSNNVHLSLEEVAGKKVLHFDGIPVRRCDQLLGTEARVV
jgi:hypothetical protein